MSRYDRLGTAGSPPVRAATEEDVNGVAALHVERISEGFLSNLGIRFLRRLYRRILRSPRAFILVAGERSAPVGFVAVTESTAGLYREFLRRDGLVAGLTALPAMAHRPKQVWETFRYGTGTLAHGLPEAEVLAVAVARAAEGRRLGPDLVAAALDGLRLRGVASAHVVTSAENDRALRMYERCGFRPHHRTEVHRGVVQEVLVWP